ncbi:ThiF family adenylyltransferase [Kineosporia babensis]|uniref:ThiF family adenylyltransferase n=1 Tax=Kineosporia babensis TaxID=499548 RepID=A0A9X1NI18_9ACTN|nr:ThiF family adenylyltransferase [Kineosporia babensis]MCD5313641.1 ThiF family adenylyltransferase [Kineosporia babensis]
MLLRLKPGLRRVWRDPGTLQIGISRRRGAVITGLAPQDVPLVEALRHGVDPAAPGGLSAYGDPDRGRALVRLLAASGVLTGSRISEAARLGPAAARLTPDATVWSAVYPSAGDGWRLLLARAGALVVIHGAGRLGTTLSATLAAAGVGTVVVRDSGRVTAADLSPAGAGLPDLGRTRQSVGHDVVRRAGGHSERSPARTRGLADLVVLIEHGSADATRADRLMSADVPHLAVVVGEDGVVVGPLVRPGRSPCLRCLDLHRCDRDPQWPMVLAQLHEQSSPEPEESASAGLAAGLAALQVLAQLDGRVEPAALGATLEVELPDGLTARRLWPVHPACGCTWATPPADEASNRNPARGAR